MTTEEILEFQDSENYYTEFYLKASKDGFTSFAKGLEILGPYVGKKDLCAQHDVIYVGLDCDFEKMTLDMVKELASIGFSYDDENDCWVFHT